MTGSGIVVVDYTSAWQQWFPWIEAALGELSKRMLDRAGVATGDRVLDLATGIGEPALSAAKRVGPEGQVLGVDISAAMIDLARLRARAAGLSNVEFRVMDAGALSVAEKFDAVLSRCGLMFVDDLPGTLDRVRRALVPGGRISAAVWASADEAPTLSLAERTAHRVLGLPPPDEGEETPFALCDAGATVATMRDAGFENVRLDSVPVTFEFASTTQFIAYRDALSSRFTAPLDGRDDRAREAVVTAVTEAVEPYQRSDGTLSMVNRAYCLSAMRRREH